MLVFQQLTSAIRSCLVLIGYLAYDSIRKFFEQKERNEGVVQNLRLELAYNSYSIWKSASYPLSFELEAVYFILANNAFCFTYICHDDCY